MTEPTDPRPPLTLNPATVRAIAELHQALLDAYLVATVKLAGEIGRMMRPASQETPGEHPHAG